MSCTCTLTHSSSHCTHLITQFALFGQGHVLVIQLWSGISIMSGCACYRPTSRCKATMAGTRCSRFGCPGLCSWLGTMQKQQLPRKLTSTPCWIPRLACGFTQATMSDCIMQLQMKCNMVRWVMWALLNPLITACLFIYMYTEGKKTAFLVALLLKYRVDPDSSACSPQLSYTSFFCSCLQSIRQSSLLLFFAGIFISCLHQLDSANVYKQICSGVTLE